jgi:hypothetical protein
MASFFSPQASQLRWRAKSHKEVSMYEEDDSEHASSPPQGGNPDLTFKDFLLSKLSPSAWGIPNGWKRKKNYEAHTIPRDVENRIPPWETPGQHTEEKSLLSPATPGSPSNRKQLDHVSLFLQKGLLGEWHGSWPRPRSLLHASLVLNALLLGLFNLTVHVSWSLCVQTTLLVTMAVLSSMQRHWYHSHTPLWKSYIQYSRNHLRHLQQQHERSHRQRTTLETTQEQLQEVPWQWKRRIGSQYSLATVQALWRDYEQVQEDLQHQLQQQVDYTIMQAVLHSDWGQSSSLHHHRRPTQQRPSALTVHELERLLIALSQLPGVTVHEEHFRALWHGDTSLTTVRRLWRQVRHDVQAYRSRVSIFQFDAQQLLRRNHPHHSHLYAC